MDGNLRMYLNSLRHKGNHVPYRSREHLTIHQLTNLWETQGGRCAVSGLPMTCRKRKGERFPFNASIDCIVPISQGGRYEINNIQLVCTAVNLLMRDFSKQDFIRVVIAVADKWASAADDGGSEAETPSLSYPVTRCTSVWPPL